MKTSITIKYLRYNSLSYVSAMMIKNQAKKRSSKCKERIQYPDDMSFTYVLLISKLII